MTAAFPIASGAPRFSTAKSSGPSTRTPWALASRSLSRNTAARPASFRLNVRLYEAAERIERDPGQGFRVRTSRGTEHRARFVVIAIGFYCHPNLMGVEGEDLPKVSHYYLDPHPFWRRKVAVIGAQNSAVEAALELWRNGAEVTLIHRGAGLVQRSSTGCGPTSKTASRREHPGALRGGGGAHSRDIRWP